MAGTLHAHAGKDCYKDECMLATGSELVASPSEPVYRTMSGFFLGGLAFCAAITSLPGVSKYASSTNSLCRLSTRHMLVELHAGALIA